MSVSVCPVRDLTFESLDLEFGAPAVPGTKTVPLLCQEHEQGGTDNRSGGIPPSPGNSSTKERHCKEGEKRGREVTAGK